MSAAVFDVPFLMTQSDYEKFVTGTSFSEAHEPIDFAVDEPVISVMDADGFWIMKEDER